MMDAGYGYAGKILRIDLTNGIIRTESTRRYVPRFLGEEGSTNGFF